MKYTTTVTDYLTWRGDIPFSVDPFNEVDNLVLCIISYLDFSRFPELLTRNPSAMLASGQSSVKICRLLSMLSLELVQNGTRVFPEKS